MSGPKYSEWEVRENARLLENRRQEALAEVESLEAQLNDQISLVGSERPDLAAELRLARQRLGHVGRDCSVDAALAAASRIRSVISEALACQVRLSALRNFENAARKSAAALAAGLAERRTISEQHVGDRRDAREQLAQKILSRTGHFIADAEAIALGDFAQRFVNAEDSRAAVLELELRAEAQRLDELAARRAANAKQAAELREQLLGFEDRRAMALSDRLLQAEASGSAVEPALRSEVESTAQQLRAEIDRAFAGQVLREEFASLGYDVGEDFDTAFEQGGQLRIARRDQGPYAVELEFSPDRSGFNAELVAVDPASGLSQAERSRRDLAAEGAWCGDFAKILAASEQRQVRTRVRKRVMAGDNPVRVVEAATPARQKAKARRKASSLQSRSLA